MFTLERNGRSASPEFADELERILEQTKDVLSAEQHRKLKAAVETLAYLTGEIEEKKTSIRHLRNLLFGSKSEKTKGVLPDEEKAAVGSGGENADGEGGDGSADEADGKADNGTGKKKKKRQGHGRNGAEKYTGATTIEVSHESLNSGDACPDFDCAGKVYTLADPAVIVQITGEPPLSGTVCKLERLRCNLCLTIYTAKPPEGMGEGKYDERAAAMIGLLKYGSGLPFNRLARLEGNLGIPLPSSTQWDIVERVARLLDPVYQELIRVAAQGDVIHNDDTTMKILELMGKRQEKRRKLGEQDDEFLGRTGIFTSGIVSIREGRRIALFFTGRRHAGENLESVLRKRSAELVTPIQMSDALMRNLPGELKVIWANCLAHARRYFVDVVESFPEDCRFVLKTLGGVYKNDGLAREKKMSPQERMRFHRQESWPLVKKLRRWLKKQGKDRLVEPNSGLGTAITYMLNHWKKLTMFLRVPGAPLDNNIVERGLKKAILHRRNSLFYRSENGARVGDLFMTLIHTCELSGVSPFDYLTELQKHAAAIRENPAAWMPWNYRTHLEPAPAE